MRERKPTDVRCHGLAMLIASLLAVVMVGGARPVHAANPAFVQRQGSQLTLNGEAWHPIGWNDYRVSNVAGGFICDAARAVLTDAQMQALFTHFRTATGADVVRTWFFQSYYQANPAQPWTAFDRVLANAAAAGVKVIPVLTNNYADCESAGSSRKTVAFYQGGYKTASPTSDGYLLSFDVYATAVAQHYAGNTTIAFWQLVNEIDPSGCTQGNEDAVAAAIHDFGSTVATDVKTVDANHLVSLGTQGSGQCGTSGAHYTAVHSNTAIDMCEYHDYHEPNRAMPTGNVANSVDQGNGLATRLSQCSALGLPLIVGESGIVANVAADGSAAASVTATTLQQRADDFSAKLHSAFSSGADGYLIWEGIPDASDSAANTGDGGYGVGPGDPTEAVLLAASGSPGGRSASVPEAPLAVLLLVGGATVAGTHLHRRRRG